MPGTGASHRESAGLGAGPGVDIGAGGAVWDSYGNRDNCKTGRRKAATRRTDENRPWGRDDTGWALAAGSWWDRQNDSAQLRIRSIGS